MIYLIFFFFFWGGGGVCGNLINSITATNLVSSLGVLMLLAFPHVREREREDFFFF